MNVAAVAVGLDPVGRSPHACTDKQPVICARNLHELGKQGHACNGIPATQTWRRQTRAPAGSRLRGRLA